MKSVSLQPTDGTVHAEEYVEQLKVLSWILFVMVRDEEVYDLPSAANLLMVATTFCLKHSQNECNLQFKINKEGNKVVFPGKNKLQMEKQILEYLCGLMNFSYDDITESMKKIFDAKVEKMFSDSMKISY